MDSLKRRCALALLVVPMLIALAPAGIGGAATNRCSSRGEAVIRQSQLIIYFVQMSGRAEYRGCDIRTGRVTRLITRGEDYSAEGVVAHGRHATVVEAVDPFAQGPTVKKIVTIWDLRRGRPFATREIDAEPERSRRSPELFDSPQDDPVTAFSYLSGGRRVLDVISDKGARRLSSRSIKPGSVSVSGRTVRWREGSRRRSRRV